MSVRAIIENNFIYCITIFFFRSRESTCYNKLAAKNL